MKLACAYNVNFLSNRLSIRPEVGLIEIGIQAFNDISNLGFPGAFENYNGRYSLHIARSAITEAEAARHSFINDVIPDIKDNQKIESVGFHLCGPRCDGIGRYGFTSHYSANDERERNAVAFVEEIQQRTGKPVWIENANFYTPTARSLLENIQSTIRISNKSGCGIILDIAHLVIDARNNGLSPNTFLGFIDWSSVSEIHLSGIIKGRDGALHDGHSKEIDDECWEIFEQIARLGLLKPDVYINIEHSDDTWRDKHVEYEKDFATCLSLFDAHDCRSEYSDRSKDYARGYLKKSLRSAVVNFDEICATFEKSENDILDGWLEYVDANGVALAFTSDEIDTSARTYTMTHTESFTDYVESHLG